MKKRLLILLFLLLVGSAYAGQFDAVITQYNAAGGVESFIQTNGVETQGEDDDWTGSCDLDFSTAGLDMQGSECIECGPGEDTFIALTPSAEKWTVTRFRYSEVTEFSETLLRIKNTSTTLGWISMQNDQEVVCRTGGGSESSVITTLLVNTTYFIKVRYKQGTGANAEFEVWISTDGTTWGTPQSSTDGTETDQPNRLLLINSADTELFYFDFIKEKDSDIVNGN